jgi:hypothetical protein
MYMPVYVCGLCLSVPVCVCLCMSVLRMSMSEYVCLCLSVRLSVWAHHPKKTDIMLDGPAKRAGGDEVEVDPPADQSDKSAV